jgi:exosome complex component MTR3
MLSDCYTPRILKKESTPAIVTSQKSLRVEMGLVHNVSGSAFLELGGSKVICSVHGPHVSQRKSLFSNMGQLECDIRYSSGSSPRGEESLSAHVIVDALKSNIMLEKYSKMVISLSIVVLESKGCELAAAINCASLALVNASIEMRDVVCSSSVGMSEAGLVVFPGLSEQAKCTSSAIIATVPTSGVVTQVVLEGRQDIAVAGEMMRKCVAANRELREQFREILLENIKNAL